MKWTHSVLTVALLSTVTLAAQAPDRIPIPPNLPTKNPLEGNAEAIRAGTSMYRQKCADCHGMDARGVRGPDLTQVWATGRTDDGLFRTLRNGVPGTEMPPVAGFGGTSDEDLWKMLAYLKTLAAPAPNDPPRGNAENGEKIFRVNCLSCHRVNNAQGGRLGPDLSRVGLSRTRAALTRQIRGAVEEFKSGYEPVTLTTPAGQQISGVKKNEDLFSVQIMDTRERIQGYRREDMRAVTDGKVSAMPVFDVNRLSDSNLEDLLAYLATLHGASTEAPIEKR
jgi:putative heme-binding domain-containing protein